MSRVPTAPVLDTARLELRPYALRDVDALHRLWTDPHVRRYLWDDTVIARETAAAVVEGSLADWAAHGYGQWAIRVPPDREVVGFVGFRSDVESPATPELLYGLHPRRWGRGLVDEAARAAVAHAFETLALPSIWAATDPPNAASIRVMERLGMRFDRRGLLNGLDTVFYTLDPLEFARSYEVRWATPADLEALPAIERAAAGLLRDAGFAGTWLDAGTPPAAFEDACRQYRLWVALQGGRLPVGFALVTFAGDQPHLEEIDVHPDHGRHGVGTRLLRAVIAAARAAGYGVLTLSTFRDPPWNAPWYRRHGFADVEEAAQSPALRQVVAGEARRGLPVGRRTVMALAL